MKNRILVAMFCTIFAVNMIACGKEETVEPEVTEQVEESVEEAPTEESAEITDEKRQEIFTSYIDGQTKLADKSYKMNAGNSENDGIYGDVESESGLLYWQFEGANLITAEYDGSANSLSYKSLAVNEAGETEVVSETTLEDFIRFSDDSKVLFSTMNLNDKPVIMVESRGLAYTYADGVDYHITLIEIGDDGNLSKIYEDGLAGSGDDDITSEFRKSFNDATGLNYDKDFFEDVFYNGNLIIEKENKPVQATITFKSESSKLADAENWEGANEITNKLYELFDKNGETIYWGEGQFTTK